MKSHALAVLELVLEKARHGHATEIRFISGMYPAVVVENAPRFVEVADLKLETVRNIHHECLSLAARPDLVSRARVSYAFTSQWGRFLCKYQLRGNTASLTLLPEAGTAEIVDAIRPNKLPSRRAEARPDESGPIRKRRH
jgi:hypothetical protein